jgi:hypothetical protein
MQLDDVRSEIERMRTQVNRQRGEIRQLQRAGISTASAEALLERMLNRVDELCIERDRLKKKLEPVKCEAPGGRSWSDASLGHRRYDRPVCGSGAPQSGFPRLAGSAGGRRAEEP